MDKYRVKINPKAIRELDGIYEYIAEDKQSPENAKAQVDRIKISILKSGTFPQSHQERNEGTRKWILVLTFHSPSCSDPSPPQLSQIYNQ